MSRRLEGTCQQRRPPGFLRPDSNRPWRERERPPSTIGYGSAKRDYDDKDGSQGRDCGEQSKRSRRDSDSGQWYSSPDQITWREGQVPNQSNGRDVGGLGRSHGDWSDSTCRSTVSFRSTEPKMNEGRGRRDRAQGQGGRSFRGGGRRNGATGMRRRGPDFRPCKTVGELADLARFSLDSMSHRDIAAFWSLLPRLLHQRSSVPDPTLEENLRCVISTTCNRMRSFRCRDLTQTSLGIAKTISQVRRGHQQCRANDPLQITGGLLLSDSRHFVIFDVIGRSAVSMLESFDARHLSNLVFSFGLVNRNPDIGDDTLFNVVGSAAAKIMQTFDPQDIANMLLAYVYVGAKNSSLFRKIRETILGTDLGIFEGQALANIVWSFSKSGEADREMFNHIGDHIVARSLYDFLPQEMSIIVWAYANGRVSHHALFDRVGFHVTRLVSSYSFKPQELSNIAWAFATAGESHPVLFEKIGDYVAALGSLNSFKPQELSNISWAFSAAGVSHAELFEKIAYHIAGLDCLDSFKPQELANTVHAFCNAVRPHPALFDKIGHYIAGLCSFNLFQPQNLSNIAWAFATAGESHPALFEKIGDYIAGLDSLDS
ncbi:hypothetical protein THAOC_02605, partial [Thalassiosira oceanica]